MHRIAACLMAVGLMFSNLAPTAAQQSDDSIQPEATELLYNGIQLPEVWPPRIQLTRESIPVPYLKSPPKIIPIDLGRQLFVDDFLIEQTNLQRTFHSAEYHPGNPVVRPDRAWEERVPENEKDAHGKPRGAWTFSDGVWYDPADQRFKMWYDGGFAYSTCFASSVDGIHWDKPLLDLEPGTNIILKHRRDSSTVWLDHFETNPQRRFKSFIVENHPENRLHLRYSADGLRWSEPIGISGNLGDRTTVFYNPFRRVWVASLRRAAKGLGRIRSYQENRNVEELVRNMPNMGVEWVGADRLDPPRAEIGAQPDLYTLDAVAYESLMIGAFSIFRGTSPDGTKKADVCLGFSRDGFHWDRPSRSPFLANSTKIEDWNWGYMHSAGGVCLVVGDKLYFYSCGRSPTPGGAAGLEKGARTYSTGLATLRRDGFASMSAGDDEGSLTTRSVRFTGKHLFLNLAASQGHLRVEILDESGRTIEPFTRSNSVSLSVDQTLAEVKWMGVQDLSALIGRTVKFRFHLKNGSLYSFWVSQNPSGASNGFVAAGGPGFSGPVDTVGSALYNSKGLLP